ncbi:MAG: hypothetical protein IJZ35_04860 [Clostridia bacterium]|nr:hypothetical protein [Clostridia bacterium]
MKKNYKRIVAIVLCVMMMFSCTSAVSFAAETTEISFASVGDSISKGFYNALNNIVEGLVSAICKIYPNPPSWMNLSDYDSDEIGFLPGHEIYQTEAGEDNHWSLGYASVSIVPEDVDSGEYNLGRDLNNKMAKGVYDDQRIRVVVIDDNSGEGAVVIGSIDALGVTSTDARAIRMAVVEYCEEQGIDVASVNICATHSHSALDTQGVSTGFFDKLLGNFFYNAMGKEESLSGFEAADYFKSYFISQSVEAVKAAIADMEAGTLSFASVDCSEIIHDKRDLIAKEDIPETACFKFVSESGEETYIADISCHPTSFSASNGLVSSDYIYALDNYIKAQTNGNVVMVAGALGQLSRDIEVDTTGMTEWEDMGAEAKYLGEAFGAYIINAEYEELAPVLNVTHRELFVYPENSILTLACEIRLVNNRCFVDANGDCCMATEMGYVEFGNKVGLALFPAEFYPETFWGNDITGNVTWDGTEWQYDSLHDSVDGVKVYCVSLANDEIGYVLTDNNFAFMGHIIGEEIADEVLSVGKHTGSFLVGEYYEMIEDYVK